MTSATQHTSAVLELLGMPVSERRNALESWVTEQFKDALLVPSDEDLPLDESFFEMGLTSLRVVEIKDWLEELLGRPISANTLFNRPTLEQLLDYLSDEVIPDVFRSGK